MDNLQWFKFSPADWMMGRIQRQPPQVQVDFLRLCCKYWQKDGDLNIEDAEIEAMDSYSALVKYKIIKEENKVITIDFLDEQLDALAGKRKQASEAGKRSAEARKRKKETNDRSTTVNKPFNENEQSRVEESRKETLTEFDIFWLGYNKNVGLVRCQREWANIDEPEYAKIIRHVPKYVAATPDIQFRLNPINYLKNRTWLDVDLPKQNGTAKPQETKEEWSRRQTARIRS